MSRLGRYGVVEETFKLSLMEWDGMVPSDHVYGGVSEGWNDVHLGAAEEL